MSATEMSVESLKKSLAANGLAQYGTKGQMLPPHLTRGPEKKKPRPQPKGGVVPQKKKKAQAKDAVAAALARVRCADASKMEELPQPRDRVGGRGNSAKRTRGAADAARPRTLAWSQPQVGAFMAAASSPLP